MTAEPDQPDTTGVNEARSPVIGIDLGSSNCCVSFFNGRESIVIKSATGSSTTPSIIGFSRNGEFLIGDAVGELASTDPDRVVRSIFRSSEADGVVVVDGRSYTTHELLARVLKRLKDDAEAYLGETVTDAVVTVSGSSGTDRRVVVADACRIVGLNVLRTVSAPIASALTYGRAAQSSPRTVAVFDLGGSTLDVAIVEIAGDAVDVKAIGGDPRLGGDDWDLRLSDHVIAEVRAATGVQPAPHANVMRRLRDHAEVLKRALSTETVTTFSVPFDVMSGTGAYYLDVAITRDEFQEMTRDLVDRCRTVVLQALNDAGITIRELDQLILIGGGTRVPAVREMLDDLTGGRAYRGMHRNLAPANGAALLAGHIRGALPELRLLDVVQLSLSIQVAGDDLVTMVRRGAVLQAKRSEVFTTSGNSPNVARRRDLARADARATSETLSGRIRRGGIPGMWRKSAEPPLMPVVLGPTVITVPIYEGEHGIDPVDLRWVGVIELDLPQMDAGRPDIEIEFETYIDASVRVTVRDQVSGGEQSTVLGLGKALDQQEIARLHGELEGLAQSDRRRRDSFEVRALAEQLEVDTKRFLTEHGTRFAGWEELFNAHVDMLELLGKDDENIDAVRSAYERVVLLLRRATEDPGPDAAVAAPPAIAVDGRDIEAEMTISFPASVSGSTESVTVYWNGTCDVCGGSSKSIQECRHCNKGIVVMDRVVKVRTPAGLTDGKRLFLRSHGAPGINGGQAGDLRIVVHVEAPPRLFEAKVVLVGEGTVGKSSLLAALDGQPFDPNRPLTHAIDVSLVRVRHPDEDAEVTLRCWDFGGQKDYRATHEYFYSVDTIYLLVWNARAGSGPNDVAGWMRRIHTRAGESAKVIIVATHCHESRADLNIAALEQDFPGMVWGNFQVDNSTGMGIDDLRDTVAVAAAALRTMGSVQDPRLLSARQDLREAALNRQQISYEEFGAICRRHGLTVADTQHLAELLHQLGEVVYHRSGEHQDLVILDPEWLSKAIGDVLVDTPTLSLGGVLDHSRLSEIWGPKPGRADYKPAEYPYLLWIMERFDISYQMDEPGRSLIAPMVPAAPPALPWYRGQPVRAGMRRVRLTFELTEPLMGLIPALIVRTHHGGVHRSWSEGLFLDRAVYGSQALIELSSPTRLEIEVRAPAPALFVDELHRTVKELLKHRWTRVKAVELVPAHPDGGTGCTFEIALAPLLERYGRGERETPCQCSAMVSLDEVLAGFAPHVSSGAPGLEARLDAFVAQFAKFAADTTRSLEGVKKLDEIAAALASQQHMVRRLLMFADTEVTDTPRLVTIKTAVRTGISRAKIHQNHYELTVWCEHTDGCHPAGKSYQLERPKTWLAEVSRYARPLLTVLRQVLPVVEAMVDVTLTREQIDSAKSEVELMSALIDQIPLDDEDDEPLDVAPMNGAGAQLRYIRSLLQEIDRHQYFGGLSRVDARTGQYLWICEAHMPLYRPALPTL